MHARAVIDRDRVHSHPRVEISLVADTMARTLALAAAAMVVVTALPTKIERHGRVVNGDEVQDADDWCEISPPHN